MSSYFFLTKDSQAAQIKDRQNKKLCVTPCCPKNKNPLYLILFTALILLPVYAAAQTQTAASYYERGQNYMAQENWYSAIESFLECIRLNS
ncbi:MAG: hypothetical protein FWC17_05900, partial [Treponema sp.]|nr:hypothetical protein [Treponema sp.]